MTKRRWLGVAPLILALHSIPALAAENTLAPFATSNMNPLTQIYGLPLDTDASVTPVGKYTLRIAYDIASSYSTHASSNETMFIDGESSREQLSVRYGIHDHFEIGLNIPFIQHNGGFLDAFVNDWHKTFGLPYGGRDTAEKNRLRFSYRKDNTQKVLIDHSESGIGDLSITTGWQFYDNSQTTIALRSSLKLPTGESSALRGSGSTDASLALCASNSHVTSWGHTGIFGSAGTLVMTRGDIVPDQQNNVVVFGTVGAGWAPLEWISFKVQLNLNSPFYHGSSMTELSSTAMMLTSGGTLKLPGNYLIDIGVSEDVAVSTAPDVAFHIGLSKRF